MSATPIPRTLQTALVGLHDLSYLHTPPARRRPIRTLIADDGDTTLRQALLREHRRGGQGFVVVPRVEDIAPVADRLERLLPGLRLQVAHGALSAREIDEVMVGFAGGDGDVLLATGIIESGLDVARANTMVILRPALFGLAQLHQLRGRVVRGPVQAYCHLLTAEGEDLSDDARKRLGTLQAMDRLGAGMAISAADLDRRAIFPPITSPNRKTASTCITASRARRRRTRWRAWRTRSRTALAPRRNRSRRCCARPVCARLGRRWGSKPSALARKAWRCVSATAWRWLTARPWHPTWKD